MSNIKINDVFQRIQYAATNGQTQFTIPFPFFQNAYVTVWQDGIVINQGGGAGQYGISGAGSPSGGLITLVTPATLDSIITIEGIMPIDRTSIYSATISNLTGSDLNGDFNREVVMLKQVQTTQALLQLQYAPWALVSQDEEVTTDRYIPLLAPLEAWRMNAGGTAIETFTTPSSGGLAPDDATYILQVADSELPNAQAMGALASGLVVNTTSTGVQIIRALAGVINQTVITNASGIGGDPTVGIYPNPIIPGTEGMSIPEGTTAERPGSPAGTNLRFNTDLILNEYWDGSDWVQLSETDGVTSAIGTLDQILVNGGIVPVDGAVTYSLSPTLNLPGTFNIQTTTAINAIINDATMASATTANISTSAAIKSYVDSLVTGLNIQGSCVCATTVALTVTYANGTAGVGATLTNAGVQAALSLDGVSPTAGQRVLVKNQASSLQNGIYTVTVVGSGATNWVMTRATDYDTPTEIQKGDLVILTGGTTQTQSSWVETAIVTAVGTDPITFVQFTASLPMNVPSGGTGVTSFTAYAPIVGGTTTTGSLQSITLGAAGTLYQSAGVGSLPAFTTTTYPTTNAINTIMYASSANVLGVITPTNNGVLVYSAGGVPSASTTLPAGLTIPTPYINQINDVNGNEVFVLNGLGSAANYFNFTNSATGNGPTLQSGGSDATIAFNLSAKGAAPINYGSEGLTNQHIFFSGTAQVHSSIMNFPVTAAARTYTWPDVTGTVQIQGQSLGVATATSINFGGTTLSTFTESTWVPTLASSGGGTCTYSIQAAAYSRIGNRVFFNANIILASTSLSAGTLSITGLPFACSGFASVSVYSAANAATAITQIQGFIGNGNSFVSLSRYAGGAATLLASTDITASSQFFITGSYPV